MKKGTSILAVCALTLVTMVTPDLSIASSKQGVAGKYEASAIETEALDSAVEVYDQYEPNDDFNVAFGPISSGISYQGEIPFYEDADIFYVNAKAGNMSIYLSNLANTGTDVILLDSSLHILARSEASGSVSEAINYKLPAAGKYYIAIGVVSTKQSDGKPYPRPYAFKANFVY